MIAAAQPAAACRKGALESEDYHIARILHTFYEVKGRNLGAMKVYVDGSLVCSLMNGACEDVEISEDAHSVQVKAWGVIPYFRGTVEAGANNRSLFFDDARFIGRFVLRESKPFYGKSL